MRALLAASIDRAGLGDAGEVVCGLTPPAQALAAAAAAAVAPVLLIAPTDRDAEALAADARFFHAALLDVTEDEAARLVLALPSLEVDPYRGLAPHLDVASARARALTALARGAVRLVAASMPALLPRVSRPSRLLRAACDLEVGDEWGPTALGDLLADAGFTLRDPVEAHGEYCVRGGIVDYFAAAASYPTRVEFSGDRVESLRLFDPATQRSTAALDRTSVIPVRDTFEDTGPPADSQVPDRRATVLDYAAAGSVQIVVSNWVECERRAVRAAEQLADSYAAALERGGTPPAPEVLQVAWSSVEERLRSGGRFELLARDNDAGELAADRAWRAVSCQPAERFRGRLGAWTEALREARAAGEAQVVVAATPGRSERVIEFLTEANIPAVAAQRHAATDRAPVIVATGQLSAGFRLPDAAIRIHAETDIFGEERHEPARRVSAARSFMSGLRDLKAGDHVVHVDHGIGVFVGLRQLKVAESAHELMELRYAGGDKLFVPVEHLDLVQKYSGAAHPRIDRLGGTSWARTKTRVKRAMRDMAAELLKLYAARRAVAGHAFSPDTHWQEEFDAAFEFELTPDQAAAVRDIKCDMEAAVPMDRLLCGDVGYGKTEVALRAAFKAVMDGKQVAVLAPTTVLAFQHHRTIEARFAGFPIRSDMISRFRGPAEQKAVLRDLARGKVDVIVGTHRLLSRDVAFSDLGLLVVDEEQRFGVAHKERLKQLRKRVDVLTLTATPIPRTLHMSLTGIRDMSVIATPPKDRLSIQTTVVPFDTRIVARVIRTELERGGQVYFVHNRIHSIPAMADLIRRIVPEARLAVAHGQSTEAELERVMIAFVAYQHDVLLSTTIVENGLDIPNVNTLIVNDAQRYGLSQLYQLRGRVGRSARRAYAYLLIPPGDVLTPVAERRLAAIREFSELGSGFRIAALDLEIRGAGNLLGAEQSGHIEAIGFDLYVKLLEQAAQGIRGEVIEEPPRATVSLGVPLRLDEHYVAAADQRLAVYRRVATADSGVELTALADELADRYGPLPPVVRRLVRFGRIRVQADGLGILSITRDTGQLVMRFRDDAAVDPGRLAAFVSARRGMRLMPPDALCIQLGEDQGTDAILDRVGATLDQIGALR